MSSSIIIKDNIYNQSFYMHLPSEDELLVAYQKDLASSFPSEELKPLSNLTRRYNEGVYQPWCLFKNSGDEGVVIHHGESKETEEFQINEKYSFDNTPIGECFLWFGTPGWALLDYLSRNIHGDEINLIFSPES